LAAGTSTGKHFSSFTDVPTGGSPHQTDLEQFIVGNLNLAAVKPKEAVMGLMMWVSSIVAKGANNMTESDAVMVPQGMCLDHVVLVKTTIARGLPLPLWRLSYAPSIRDRRHSSSA